MDGRVVRSIDGGLSSSNRRRVDFVATHGIIGILSCTSEAGDEGFRSFRFVRFGVGEAVLSVGEVVVGREGWERWRRRLTDWFAAP